MLTPLNVASLAVVVPFAALFFGAVPVACWRTARQRRADRAHWAAGAAAARDFRTLVAAHIDREGR